MNKIMEKINKKTFILGILVIAILLFSGIKLFKVTEAKEVQPQMKLPETSKVEKGDFDQRVSASGTVAAADEHSIFIELSQEVKEVFAEVGDKVEEGQLLVTYAIDDTRRELQNKVTEAEINIQNAQISLNEISSPASGSELLDLQSQVVSAQKNLDDTKTEISSADSKISQAERDLQDTEKTMENNKVLLEIGAVTQLEYDESVKAYENAKINLDTAKDNKASKESSIESLEIALEKAKLNLENGQNKLNDESTANSYKKQENSLKTAKINLQTAQENLSKLTEATYSPISGTVLVSNAVEGQMLTDSTVMMKVADLSNLDVKATVSEYDIAKIKVGQKVEMTSDGIEGKVYTGTVTKIEPSATSQSTISGSETVVPIVVHMDNPDDLIKPGFSLDLEIIVVDLKDISYIPVSSVIKEKDSSTYVYTVDTEGVISKTQINLGTYNDMYVELIDGLDENSIFIKSPNDTVEAGKNISDYMYEVNNSSKENKEATEQNSGAGMQMQMDTMAAPSGGRGGNGGGGGMSVRMP